MTEAEAQAQLHILYEGNVSTPGATTADYLARRGLMNGGIAIWEKEAEWRELFAKLADAADGDTTTTDGTADYDCPTDFEYPVGYLRIGTTKYPYYSVEKFQLISSSDSSTKFFYVTGNKNAGFTVNIHPTPSSTGDTITYEYYKAATALSAITTVFEMSDPYFAIYFALSKLLEQDGKMAEAQKAFMESDSRLQRMKEKNFMVPFYQTNTIPDDAFTRGVGGFGK